jgi:hypothetical protein
VSDERNILEPIPVGPPSLGIVGEDNVITAKRKLTCLQERILVDEQNRRVHCGKCGREIDPIEALMILARDPDRWKEWIEQTRQQRDKGEAELLELKRQVANAKATLRRISLKLAPPATTGEEQ